jgi:hypothetical protein
MRWVCVNNDWLVNDALHRASQSEAPTGPTLAKRRYQQLLVIEQRQSNRDRRSHLEGAVDFD